MRAIVFFDWTSRLNFVRLMGHRNSWLRGPVVRPRPVGFEWLFLTDIALRSCEDAEGQARDACQYLGPKTHRAESGDEAIQ